MKKLLNVCYATDLLIFGIDSRKTSNTRALPKKYLSILLVKRNKNPFVNQWCLPGGFVDKNETSFEASSRVLKKETNLEKVYMQQLQVNDNVNRDPRGRVVSVSYMALVDRTLLTTNLNNDACWFDIEINENLENMKVKLSNESECLDFIVQKNLIDKKSANYQYDVVLKSALAFDHDEIIIKGLMELRNKVNNTDIVFNLMPDKFTIGELKQVYELLLNKKLINSAFRRTIAEKVVLTEEMIKTGGHRPSFLCKYKDF